MSLPRSWWLVSSLVLLAGWVTSCSSTPTTSPTAGGWELVQGQALWRPRGGQSEIAGELLIGTRGGHEQLVEFTKTPFPLVVAKSTAAGWEIKFGPDGPRFSGRGDPPNRLIWFFLRDCVEARRKPPAGWTLHMQPEGHWRFENRSSGESLEGYLKNSAQ